MPNEKFGLSNVEKGTTEPDKQGVIWIDDTSGDVKLQYNAGGGTPAYKTLGGGAGTNALLDGTNHTDTTAYTVTRGAIPYGKGASPTWDGLAIGARGKYLMAGSAEPYWGAPLLGTPLLRGRRIHHGEIFGFGSSGSQERCTFGSTALSAFTLATAVSTDLSNQRGYITATATNNGRVRGTGAGGGEMYPYFRAFVQVTDNVDGCMWIGFGNSAFTSAADPGTQCAVFRCRNGTDTNWQAITSDSGGTEQTTDTGIALDSNFHLFEIVTEDGGTNWKFYIDGALEATHGVNVPTATTSLQAMVETFSISSSTREFYIKSFIHAVGNPANAWDDIEASSFI